MVRSARLPRSRTLRLVGKEVERWVATKGSGSILSVLTDGAWVWNGETNDFDRGASTGVHPSLYGIFRSEPRYLDMAWAKNENHLTLRNTRFRDQVAHPRGTYAWHHQG